MSELSEDVWLGRDNTIQMELSSNGAAIDHTAILRILAIANSAAAPVTLDSLINPEFFDFTNADRLILKFGASSLVADRYQVQLIIYDGANPNGIVWGDWFGVIVSQV